MDRKKRLQLDDSTRNENGSVDNNNNNKRQKETLYDADNGVNRWTGRAYSARFYSLLETRQKLPVYQFREKLIHAVHANQIVIIEGETGSGKSTCVCVCV